MHRFTEAFNFARELHDGHVRKGTQTPYLSHLMAVASLVLESGGNEDEAIAALLHDAVEDCGGQPILDKIREKFGKTVADIVEGCTEMDRRSRPRWRERKEAYITQIGAASPSVKRVACADKLHNLRSILTDYRQVGEKVWERFNAGKQDILWFYQSMVETLVSFGQGLPIFEDLDRATRELEVIVLEG